MCQCASMSPPSPFPSQEKADGLMLCNIQTFSEAEFVKIWWNLKMMIFWLVNVTRPNSNTEVTTEMLHFLLKPILSMADSGNGLGQWFWWWCNRAHRRGFYNGMAQGVHYHHTAGGRTGRYFQGMVRMFGGCFWFLIPSNTQLRLCEVSIYKMTFW